MRIAIALAAAGLIASASPALGQRHAALAAAIKADYDKDLKDLFLDFHRNPELSYKEARTAAIMAKKLREVGGIEVTEKVGGTVVVGVMRNGPGPVVMLRADMDGLPVEEKSGLPYASKVRQVGIDGVEVPVMHACGHDVHITAMLGAARRLAAMKESWSGTIVFVVQPAEERIGGAAAMLKDGLYTRFPKPEYALALHVAADLATGRISAAEGLQYSSADSVDVTVRGIGAHGASPNEGKDPIYIASQIVVAMQGIIGREREPLAPGVITVGAFHSGLKHNIIPDRADLQITVRANDEETRAQLLAAIRRVAEGIARANGVPEDKLPIVKVSEGAPTTVNDPALARRLNSAIARELGAGTIVPYVQKGMGAEDFSYFVERRHGVKGYYFNVGGTPQAAFDAARAGGPQVPSHHSPEFRIDPEPSIRTGAEAMTVAMLELLGKGRPASGAAQ